MPVVALFISILFSGFLNEAVAAQQLSKTVAAIFPQKLLHNDSNDGRIFNQRYWVNSELVLDPVNAPVIFYLCGESECSPGHFSGPILGIAQEHHAHLVALEHRFYGQTQPFADHATANLASLTTDSALQDAITLKRFLATQYEFRGKWIVLGGSYSGFLAALLRQQYPNEIFAAYASSAPFLARGFPEADLQISENLGPECTARMRRVYSYVEQELKSGEADRIQAVKKPFQAEEMRDNRDFFFIINDALGFVDQTGGRDYLCSKLEMAADDATATTYFAETARMAIGMYGLELVQGSFQGTSAEKYNDMRAWSYQVCTEYNWVISAVPDLNKGVFSKSIQADDVLTWGCEISFGKNILQSPDKTNSLYHDKILSDNVDRILLVNSSKDSWAQLSILPDKAPPHITSLLIDGGLHTVDMHPSKDPKVIEVQEKVRDIFRAWMAE